MDPIILWPLPYLLCCELGFLVRGDVMQNSLLADNSLSPQMGCCQGPAGRKIRLYLEPVLIQMKSMLLPEVLNNQFVTKGLAGLWEMALYREPSVGLRCWQARHCTAVVVRSALVGGSACFWAHSELPAPTQWLLHFWANVPTLEWVITEVGCHQLAVSFCLFGCLVTLLWVDALIVSAWSLKCSTKILILRAYFLRSINTRSWQTKAHRPNPPIALF